MGITTPLFFIFLCISISLYFILPKNKKNISLLFSSLVFLVTYDINLVLLLLPYTLINYVFIKIKKNKNLLLVSVSFNLAFLIFYKYSLFLLTNLNKLDPSILIPNYFNNLVLPLGISFFTFKTISLLVDSYKNAPKKISYLEFLNYILFFPQFLSGPIERYESFNQSLKKPVLFSSPFFFQGSQRILFGLFKKLVIANNISLIISPIFNSPSDYHGLTLLFSAYLFSFQIFFDFSGYSDIAIGIAKILGFNTPENFDNPYLATNVKQFWQKWHISLSSWFRDYLYIPLGGNRKGSGRQYFNILIVFLATGLWHGSSWNFIIWGLLHGLLVISSTIFAKTKIAIPKVISIFLTFNFVTFSWIFFHANGFKQSLVYIKNMVDFTSYANLVIFSPLQIPTLSALIIYFLFFKFEIKKTAKPVILGFFYGLVLAGTLLFASTQTQDFLYFKF